MLQEVCNAASRPSQLLRVQQDLTGMGVGVPSVCMMGHHMASSACNNEYSVLSIPQCIRITMLRGVIDWS